MMYRKGARCNISSLALMRHRVYGVIDSDSNPERRISLRIFGIVRPFPGITGVVVHPDGHLHAMGLVIPDSAPMRHNSAVQVRNAASQGPLAGDLIAFFQIKHS